MIKKYTGIKKYMMFAFLAFIVSMAFLRIFYDADFYDEIINLTAAYRIAIGQLPFYECWESYQTGDYFMAVFIWLFIRVTGDTNGIILYARIIYMLSLFGTAYLAYWTAKDFIDKEHGIYISAYITLFQLYGLFYLWYDSLSTILLLVGTLFLLKCMERTNVLFACGAGICHALMALAYPSYIIVVIYIVIIQLANLLIRDNRKNKIKRLVFYSAGGGMTACAIIIWLLCIEGWEKLCEGLGYLFSLRSFSQVNEKINIFYWMIKCFFKLNKWLIVPTILIFILFSVSYYRMKKEKNYNKYLAAILLIIVIMPLINFYGFVLQMYRGLPTFMAYIGVWAPFFVCFIREEKNRKSAIYICMFMWIPSVITSFCVATMSMPTVDGPIKCWQGMLGCAISAFLCILLVFKEQDMEYKNSMISIWFAGVLAFTLCMNYSYVYQSPRPITDNRNLVKDGIYMGIRVSDDIKEYTTIEPIIEQYRDRYETIYAGDIYRTAYLMSGLRPCTAVIEGLYWPLSIQYFELKGVMPDVIVLDSTEITDEITAFLDEYYVLAEDYHWHIYNMKLFVIKN